MPITDRGAPHSQRRALVVNAAELLREPGATRIVAAHLSLDEVELADPRLHGDVDVSIVLTSTRDRVLAAGEIRVGSRTECVRCLTAIDRTLTVTTSETFVADPPDEEFFPIEHGQLDLAALVREAVLLALPDAPLCRPECAGLCPSCGVDRNAEACDCGAGPLDARWAALDQLGDDSVGER